jgi:hypothetical protein
MRKNKKNSHFKKLEHKFEERKNQQTQVTTEIGQIVKYLLSKYKVQFVFNNKCRETGIKMTRFSNVVFSFRKSFQLQPYTTRGSRYPTVLTSLVDCLYAHIDFNNQMKNVGFHRKQFYSMDIIFA